MYTKGPWEIGTACASQVYIPCEHPHRNIYAPGATDAEANANARLIAAAPELVEALTATLAYAEAYYRTLPDDGPAQDHIMTSIIEPARAALAKAKGDPPCPQS